MPDPDGLHSFGHGRRKHLQSGQWLWATSSKVDLYSAQYSHVHVWPLWAALKLVASDLVSTDALLAVEALDHGKRTAFQLAFGQRIRVQMLVPLPEITLPLATAEAMGTVDAEFVQRSLEALVGHGSESRLVTQRTRLAIFSDTLDARLAIAVSATDDEVRLAKDLEADGALALELFRRRFYELALVSRFLFSLSGSFLSPLSSLPLGARLAISLAQKGRISACCSQCACAAKPFLLAVIRGKVQETSLDTKKKK